MRSPVAGHELTLRERVARRMRRHQHLLLERARRGAIGDFIRSSNRLYPHIYGPDPTRVEISPDAVVNDTLFNCASGRITVRGHAFFGHGVALLTGTHDISALGAARQSAVPTTGGDIVVEDGAWIASNATVLGPCHLGEHSVVAAGAVVTADEVPPFTIVAGVPARVVGRVPGPSAGS